MDLIPWETKNPTVTCSACLGFSLFCIWVFWVYFWFVFSLLGLRVQHKSGPRWKQLRALHGILILQKFPKTCSRGKYTKKRDLSFLFIIFWRPFFYLFLIKKYYLLNFIHWNLNLTYVNMNLIGMKTHYYTWVGFVDKLTITIDQGY